MRYLFEDYAFDTDRRELHRGSEAVSIAPQVFDLIEYLIHNCTRTQGTGTGIGHQSALYARTCLVGLHTD